MKYFAALILAFFSAQSFAAGIAYCSGTSSSLLASGTYQAKCSVAWSELNPNDFVSMTFLFNTVLPQYAGKNESEAADAALATDIAILRAFYHDLDSRIDVLEAGEGGSSFFLLPPMTLEESEQLAVAIIGVIVMAWAWRKLRNVT